MKPDTRPMLQIVNECVSKAEIEPDQRWGPGLMRRYARQIDRAERIKREVLKLFQEMEDNDIAVPKYLMTRFERIEKYINAEATVNKTGPLLLQLMKDFGMTPSLSKVKSDGNNGSGSTNQDPEEDELQRLRKRRASAGSA